MIALMHPAVALSTILPEGARSYFGLSSKSAANAASLRRGPYYHLPETVCAICHENALTDYSPTERADAFTQAAQMARSDLAEGNADEQPTHGLTTPYRASCGHVYCYVCITDRILRNADDGSGPWFCLRCSEPVHGAERVYMKPLYWTSDGENDDEGSPLEWNSDYFDEIGSSLSGVSGLSIGSRSWSEGERSD
jgi:peroxin-2